MSVYLDCPSGCGGEKVFEENRYSWNEALAMAGGDRDWAWSLAKWSAEDGMALDTDASCACPLTDEAADLLADTALQHHLEALAEPVGVD